MTQFYEEAKGIDIYKLFTMDGLGSQKPSTFSLQVPYLLSCLQCSGFLSFSRHTPTKVMT